MFKVQGLPQFDYPSELQVDEESGKGENKWVWRLVSNKLDLLVEASGFFYVPDHLLKIDESAMDFIVREFRQHYQKLNTDLQVDGSILRITGQKNRQTDFIHIFHVPHSKAQGREIKSWYVEFPNQQKPIVAKMEASLSFK